MFIYLGFQFTLSSVWGKFIKKVSICFIILQFFIDWFNQDNKKRFDKLSFSLVTQDISTNFVIWDINIFWYSDSARIYWRLFSPRGPKVAISCMIAFSVTSFALPTASSSSPTLCVARLCPWLRRSSLSGSVFASYWVIITKSITLYDFIIESINSRIICARKYSKNGQCTLKCL